MAVFENMNEYVYATDIETHEIVYMNRKHCRHMVYNHLKMQKEKNAMKYYRKH